MASLLKWIKKEAGNIGHGVGAVADAVIPGNQSYLHNGSSPQQIAQQAGHQIGQAANAVSNFAGRADQAAFNTVRQAPVAIPQVPNLVLNKIIKPIAVNTAQTVGGALNPLPIIHEWSSDPRIAAQGRAEFARQNAPVRIANHTTNAGLGIAPGKSGHQKQNPIPDLLKAGGELTNLVTSAMPLVGFGGRVAGEGAAQAIARSAAQNAAYGGLVGGAQGGMSGKLKDVGKGALLGAGAGAALGAGGEALGQGVAKVATSPHLRNEIGAVGKNVNAPKGVPIKTAQEYSKAFNVPLEQAQKELSAPPKIPTAMASVEKGAQNAKNLISTPKLSPKSQKLTEGAIASLKNAPKPIELPTVSVGQPKQAILNTKAVPSLIARRAAPAIDAANNLSPADHALLDQTRTTSIKTLAKQAENPTAFTDAANKAKEYNDFTHALGTGQGQALGYRQEYGASLQYDLKDPQTAEALGVGNIPEGERQAALATSPGYAKARENGVYLPGLKRLNPNFAGDLASDAQRRGAHISELTLAKGLNEAFPGKVNIGDIPRGYTQLKNLPYGGAISVPDDIAKQLLKRGKAPEVTNLPLKGYDVANRGLKYSQLGGGTFHAFTTAATTAGQQLADAIAHPTTIPSKVASNLKLIGTTLSRGAHDHSFRQLASDGAKHPDGISSLDRATLSGVTLSPREILADANVKFFDKVKHSPINFIQNVHDMVFGRQIPEAKMMLFNQKTRGLGTTNPADLAKMQQVASAVNNFGGINRAVEGLTPTQAQRVSRAVLATDFTETKIRKLTDAISKGGPQGSIARQMVVGKVVVLALPGLAVAAAAGKLKTPEDWAKEMAHQVIDPQVATGFKTASGIAKTAKLPSTEISELTRIFTPLFDGSADKLSGVKHYGTARLSAGASTIWSLLTNQDYYGNPVVAKNNSGGLNLGKTATNLLSTKAPIPIQQGTRAAQGKESVGEAVINTLGARVTADPNDPRMKSLAYSQNAVKKYDTTIQNLWNKSHGTQKDANGNPITVVPALHTQENALDMLQHPKLIELGSKINANNEKNGLPGDPFYHLAPEQQQTVLNIQADKFRNPAEKKALTQAASAWLPQYYNDRNSFFDALNLPPSSKTQELASPTPSQHVQDLFNISDPTARAKALATDPEAQNYFTANDQYINQGRAIQGEPAIKSYPQSNSYIESQLTAKNYKDPQVRDYLNKVAEFNVTQGGAQAQFQGTQLSESALKGVKNLANYGLVKNPDGTLAVAGNGQTGSTSSGFGSSFKTGGVKTAKIAKTAKTAKTPKTKFTTTGFKTSKKLALPKGVKIKKQTAFKPLKTRKLAISKMPKIG